VAGDDGKRLNRFLAQNPTAARQGAKRGSEPGTGRAGAGELDDREGEGEPSSNPLKAIRSAVGSGDTVGNKFAWIVLGVALLMLCLGWVRYRRHPAE
jgi:hypothetical protein